MTISRILNLLFIIIGGAVAIYAQAEAQQNSYVLIIGIVLLMLGVYRISRHIPSKFDKGDNSEESDDEI